jgi:hypothetical protein
VAPQRPQTADQAKTDMIGNPLEQLREGLKDALKAGESIAERLALAEVDTIIQTRVQGIVIPTTIVAVLFACAELAGAFIGDEETLRIAVTSIVLAAWLYGTWALAVGIIEILPIVAVWASTRVGPHKLARLFLYQLILDALRRAFTNAEGQPSTASHIARYALKFSGGPSTWESYAYRLAERIAPRMVAHAVLRVTLVIVPVLAAWAYYRFKIFPDLIKAQTGLRFFEAFVYPFAALSDALFGTHLRAVLLS